MDGRLLMYVDSIPVAEGHFFPSATFKKLGFKADPGQHATESRGGLGAMRPSPSCRHSPTLRPQAAGSRVGGGHIAWVLGRGRAAMSQGPEKPFPWALQLSLRASVRPPLLGLGPC